MHDRPNIDIQEAEDFLHSTSQLLETLLDDAEEAYFHAPIDSNTAPSAERMLKIAPYIYDNPYDFVDMAFQSIAYEKVYKKPYLAGEEMQEVPLSEFIRQDALAVGEAVTEDTSWDEFACAIRTSLAASNTGNI